MEAKTNYTSASGTECICMCGRIRTTDVSTAMFAISVIIILANLWIFVTFFKIVKLERLTKFLAINLAVADLVAGLTLLLTTITEILGCTSWFVCSWVLGLVIVSCSESMYTLCFIAIERFVVVAFPDQYRRLLQTRNVIVMLVASWILAFVIGFIPLAFGETQVQSNRFGCRLFETYTLEYIMVVSALHTAELVMVVVFNTLVMVLTWKHLRYLTHSMEQSRAVSVLVQNLHMTRSLMIVSMVFVAMWVPFFIFLLWCSVRNETSDVFSCNSRSHERYASRLSGVGMCNSFMNVIVYTISSKQCRQGWRNVLCCRKNKVAPLSISLNATVDVSNKSLPRPAHSRAVDPNTI